jgi:hypothetical protein
MVHTLTSPDLMSSPLAQAVMRMGLDFNILDTNVTKFEDSLANISSGVPSSLNSVKGSLDSIESAVSDIGNPPVSHLYEQYAATHSNDALDFCKNFYISYNLTALNSAVNQANALSSRVPTESMITEQIASIINNTEERKVNKTVREQREAFDAKYALWLAEKDNLTEKANGLLSHIRDNETPKKLAELNSILVRIRQLGDGRNYSEADAIAQNFTQTLNATDSYVSSILISYDSFVSANTSASDALFEAGLYIDSDDIVAKDKLEELYTRKASIEFTTYNESPMLLSKVNNLTDELTGIKLSANSITDEEESANSQNMNSLIAFIAKPVVSLSLSIVDSVMPLSYADKEKNAPAIIGALLFIADIVIFLIVLALFFFMVRSRRIELHRLAKVLWVVIFTFFLLLLALGSLAIYNVADMQSRPTTFGPFLSEFRNSGKVGVVANLTGVNGTMRERMVNCSAEIASKAESLQKSVMQYNFNNDTCSAGNNTLSIATCQNNLDANPVVILQSGAENKATFIVFYTKKALFEGDEGFFRECPILKVLS